MKIILFCAFRWNWLTGQWNSYAGSAGEKICVHVEGKRLICGSAVFTNHNEQDYDNLSDGFVKTSVMKSLMELI